MLWFGMSIAGEDVLRELSQETVVLGRNVPATDMDRRYEVLVQEIGHAAHNIVSLVDGAKSRFPEGFLHFGVAVGPASAPICDAKDWILPFGSPYVEPPLDPSIEGLSVRTQLVKLHTELCVQIASFWLPGKLSVPAAFATRSRL